MQTKLAAGIVSAGLLLGAATARGHHAFSAEFDANSPIKLEGTVAKVEWVNPHAWIYVDVKKADGTMEQWKIEGGTPNALFRRGFTKDSLKIGTAIVVTGFRAKDGTLKGNGRDLTFPDGRKLFLGSSGTGAPGDGGNPPEK
jgi:uncharacterized protein DUF6152